MEALLGLLGVVVGGFLTSTLTAFWSKRNWQLSELYKNYSALFVEGEREVGICDKVIKLSQTGDRAVKQLHEEIGKPEDSRFLKSRTTCWLLERKPDIRSRLEGLKKPCTEFRDVMLAAEDMATERDKKGSDQRLIEEDFRQQRTAAPTAEAIKQLLNDLRNLVAQTYFHDREIKQDLSAEKAS